MSASWYDVLGVEPDATSEEIRAAWKDSIGDLDPGDRRFRLYNSAAEVLLDDEARAEYDAELAGDDPEEAGPEEDDAAEDGPEGDDAATPVVAAEPEGESESGELEAESESQRSAAEAPSGLAARVVPIWLLAILALVVVAVSTLALMLHADTQKGVDVADAVTEARQAAEDGMPLVFSYDYRHPEQDHDRATRVLTGDQLAEYEALWKDAIEPNLKSSKGVVSSETLRSAVVNSDDDGDKVEILLVLATKQANATQQTQLTIPMNATMVRKDGKWLISKVCDGGDCSGDSSAGTGEDRDKKQ